MVLGPRGINSPLISARSLLDEADFYLPLFLFAFNAIPSFDTPPPLEPVSRAGSGIPFRIRLPSFVRMEVLAFRNVQRTTNHPTQPTIFTLLTLRIYAESIFFGFSLGASALPSPPPHTHPIIPSVAFSARRSVRRGTAGTPVRGPRSGSVLFLSHSNPFFFIHHPSPLSLETQTRPLLRLAENPQSSDSCF